ncbi:MAG: hypothetical protein L6R35_003841, partial [Caloplaca aegaea]
MDYQDNVRIFAKGVEDAKREQQARGQEVGPSVDLKLTVDLSKRNIDEVPHEAIDLLTSELLSLPHLEILDLSINEIRAIPESIRSMRSLRVLSLTKNKIWDLPSCIKDLDTLRMLKLAGNPLRPELASIVEAKDAHLPFDEAATDNEKETFITSTLKHHLKVAAANESDEGSSSEGPLETPRPFMRNGSIRFPVKANGSAGESNSELRSPTFAPPIPARSHFRVTSGQDHLMQKSGLRRPGLAPLSIGNERNRSNSESILQATQNNRSKRMGMVPKKNHGLGTVEESQQNRTSWHLRGQSHASALRDWTHEGEVDDSAANNRNGTSLPDPQAVAHPPGTFVRYFAKPRKHRKRRSKLQLFDATVGVRFSLTALDQRMIHLVESLSSRSRSSWSKLRDAQHRASFKSASLHRSVDNFFQEAQSEFNHRFPNRRAASLSINACSSAVGTYMHLGNLLLSQSSEVLADGKDMYIRALVLQTFASCVELCHAFHDVRRPSKRTTIIQEELPSGKASLQVFGRSLRDEPCRDQSLTPTRERPVTAKRVKDWNLPQQTNLAENIKQMTISRFPTSQPQVPQTATFPPTVPQSAVPLYLNGRSRSNSRVDQYNLPSSTESTFALSPVMTPSSMGAFSVPGTPLNRSRSSSIAAGAHTGRMTPASTSYFNTDPDLQRRFDKIHNLLDQTVQHSRKALPKLKEHFIKPLSTAQKNLDQGSCEQWAKRVRACSMAAELSSIMLKRLQAIKNYQPQHLYDYPPNNPSLAAAWNDRPFWELCKKFLSTTSDLLMDVRAAYRNGLVADDVVNLMRPVAALSKATSHEIHDSPWTTFLSSSSSTLMASSPGSSASVSGYHRQRRSSGENSCAAGIPPTPLSAALGPAAQATVPSTPASSAGSLERSFQGSFSERADTFLQSQQQHTM